LARHGFGGPKPRYLPPESALRSMGIEKRCKEVEKTKITTVKQEAPKGEGANQFKRAVGFNRGKKHLSHRCGF